MNHRCDFTFEADEHLKSRQNRYFICRIDTIVNKFEIILFLIKIEQNQD